MPFVRSLFRLVLLAAAIGAPGAALAQKAVCQGLRNELAALTRADTGRAGAYAGAAERQMVEMRRMAAYGHAIGCDNRRFLIFGSDPPAQCADVAARMARMQANLARLRQRASELGAASAVAARRRQTELAIQQYCAQPPPDAFDPAAQPLEEGVSGDSPDEADRVQAEPESGAHFRLPPGRPVCVRLCDGYFFPLATAGDLGPEGAPQMCQAQCPGTQTQAFFLADGDDITQAIGPNGESYTEIPNALRYQKARVSGCSCRKTGESWGEALRGAQDMLGAPGPEVIVSADEAEKMSRPAAPAQGRKPRDGRSPGARAGGGGQTDQPATAEAPASPLPGAALAPGPDGKRDVRIIAPTAIPAR